MKFRPCIDIHNGKVKQIVGGSLKDAGNFAKENFVSGQDAAFYARLYRDAGLTGGHVILLNPQNSPEFPATKQQALLALAAYPGGLQLGGGVNPQNAGEYLDAGASHVIVTSYVFKDGRISWEHLGEMEQAAGIDTELAQLLGQFGKCPVTYAGGVGSMEDIDVLRIAGGGRLDVTVGSALDLFGGSIPFTELAEMNRQNDGFCPGFGRKIH